MSTIDRAAPALAAATALPESTALQASAPYRPPALTVLGTVADLTLGNVGSRLDNNGRGSHGKSKGKGKGKGH